jgi:hypothetical protein
MKKARSYRHASHACQQAVPPEMRRDQRSRVVSMRVCDEGNKGGGTGRGVRVGREVAHPSFPAPIPGKIWLVMVTS